MRKTFWCYYSPHSSLLLQTLISLRFCDLHFFFSKYYSIISINTASLIVHMSNGTWCPMINLMLVKKCEWPCCTLALIRWTHRADKAKLYPLQPNGYRFQKSNQQLARGEVSTTRADREPHKVFFQCSEPSKPCPWFSLLRSYADQWFVLDPWLPPQ